jgi:hypothetical protein
MKASRRKLTEKQDSIPKLARQDLKTAYQQLGLSINEASKRADSLENALHQYAESLQQTNKPAKLKKLIKNKAYAKRLEILKTFLNPHSFLGQFAIFFQAKALQKVYPPKRLVELEFEDFLPEVYLSPKATPANLLALTQQLNSYFESAGVNFLEAVKPGRIKFTGAVPELEKTDLIENVQVDVKDLCENPYWETKRVNMIVCKESGRFYCLDLEKLLAELSEHGTAHNYVTGKKLGSDIIANLKAMHNQEPKHRTGPEKEDLRQTLNSLQNIQTQLKDKQLRENIELFGITEIDDLIEDLPPTVKHKLAEVDDLEYLETWLDENITNLSDEVSLESWLDEPIPKPTHPPIEPESIKKLDPDYVKTHVLKLGTIVEKVYSGYLNRLIDAHKQISKSLETITNPGTRRELNTLLLDTNKQLAELRQKGQTIVGLISLVKESRNLNIKRNNEIIQQIGMKRIYEPDLQTAQQERQELEKIITELQDEVVRLQSMLDE